MNCIVSNPDILSGTPVFRGTRVPVKTMFDYLSGGISSLQDFLEDYPSVSPKDAKQVVDTLVSQLLVHVKSKKMAQ